MERFNSPAIILNRTDFGEADRIITFLTPERGKLKAMAKGVRKSRSKLAGALELFSVSHIMVLPGKSDINTVMSAKLDRHYGNIVKNLERTQSAYNFMQLIDKSTHEHPEAGYFDLLDDGLAALNGEGGLALINLWFKTHLQKLTGRMPNLQQDNSGAKLPESPGYNFDLDKMRFNPTPKGAFSVNDIKFLRLAFAAATPEVLEKVSSSQQPEKLLNWADSVLQSYVA